MMRIRELREGAGMDQKDLAAEMGVNQNTVSNWETEVSLPKSRELPKLAKVFGCTISDLYEPEQDTA